MATITLRVPDELDDALERQSNAAGVSKSDLAREALRRFLVVSEFQRLRAKLVRRAQARGIHTDDDVFRILDRS
jgi:predicted transcriptional regulator